MLNTNRLLYAISPIYIFLNVEVTDFLTNVLNIDIKNYNFEKIVHKKI